MKILKGVYNTITKKYEDVEVNDEVYRVFNIVDRKMRYMQYDLKSEKIMVDVKNERISIIPSREDSLDRLIDDNKEEFADEQESVESIVERKVLLELLPVHIQLLTQEERELIDLLYNQKISERELAVRTGIPRKTISYRKDKILRKLKKYLK
ncbi:sigma factor-like helix-turn-helix DNA-binding protein [Paludicola sp. MB14-C6]|uniref:RNA polymerase sigma factor n=1 Tax=Paludihabitans sp. MB14-C6 TaxID=3070656 RepID=UPI0027DB3861|nr:sigma factor-like helix-turn-helix DNA-binding protein [Paludicola sp. MB14-C6]WMJ22926.1 sigma factor-like helix-turn-helix DNA-binding protein [Paludicola sp. MB14-C6]